MTIGFIGQGFIGKSYADAMEGRGKKIVRYSLDEAHRDNKEKIKSCDIVFIAVPTPTTPRGFDHSIVKEALKLVGVGKIAVIKSTVLPGTTRALQKQFPKIFVMHSPEFLVLRHAAMHAAKPERTIVGVPKKTHAFLSRAKAVLSVLPKAPVELVCTSDEAELIKYSGNLFLYMKVLYANLIYDAARVVGADYEVVRGAVGADPRIGPSHLHVLHDSGHKGAKMGRGAGGVCFIKDVEAFRKFYTKTRDKEGAALLEALITKNVALLRSSRKDLDLLEGVYSAAIKGTRRT